MIEGMTISKEELKGILKAHVDESEWNYNNWDLIIERAEKTTEFEKEYGECYKFYLYGFDLILKSNGAYVQAEPHI